MRWIAANGRIVTMMAIIVVHNDLRTIGHRPDTAVVSLWFKKHEMPLENLTLKPLKRI